MSKRNDRMSKKHKGLVKNLPEEFIRKSEIDINQLVRIVQEINHKIHEIYDYDPLDDEYRKYIMEEYTKLNEKEKLVTICKEPYRKFILSLQGATEIGDFLIRKEVIGVCPEIKRQIKRILLRRANFFTGTLQENYEQSFIISKKELAVIDRIIAKELMTLILLIGEKEVGRLQKIFHSFCTLDDPSVLNFSIEGAIPIMDWIFECDTITLDLVVLEDFTTRYSRPEVFTIFTWYYEWIGVDVGECNLNVYPMTGQYVVENDFPMLLENIVKRFLPGLYPFMNRVAKVMKRMEGFVFSMGNRIPSIFSSCFRAQYFESKNPIVTEFETQLKQIKKNFSNDPGLVACKISDLYIYVCRIFSFFQSKNKHEQVTEIVFRELVPLFLKEINVQDEKILDKILEEEDKSSEDSPLESNFNKILLVDSTPPIDLLQKESNTIETYEELVQHLSKGGTSKDSKGGSSSEGLFPKPVKKSQPITLELKVRKLVSLLKSMGFKPVRQNGTSHQIWKKGEKFTILPIHGDSVKSNIARSIYQTLGL